MLLDIKDSRGSLLVQFRKNCNLNQNNIEDLKAQLLGKITANQMVILDFSKVDFVDSAGLTMLIYMRRRILDKKGKLRLIRVGDRIKKLMQITRLHRILEVYPSIADALKDGRAGDNTGSEHPAQLHLKVKHAGHYSLVKLCQPDALIAANCKQFENQIVEYLRKKNPVILNFDEVRYIDSDGIATLIRLKETAVEGGGTILLVANNQILDRLFKLYALENLFARFSNDAQAISSLKPPPVPRRRSAKSVISAAVSEIDAVLAELQYNDILFLEAQRK